MSKTKRQHFVPRCYLERFVNPLTGRLSAFDKFTKKMFDTSVWNIAQERFFYDLQPEAIKEEHRNTGIDLQAVEKALSVIEGYFARALDTLLDGVEQKGIPPTVRWMLAVQVAIQWTRTKRFREAAIQLSQKYMQAHSDELVRRNFPDLPRDRYPTLSLEEHSASALHNQLFFDDEHWEKLARVFINHIWLIGVNETVESFYTSDHPVVRRSNVPNERTGGIGIDSLGVEFFMPISPRYGLIMLERTFFQDWAEHDGGVVGIRSEAVDGYNRLQVIQSHRHVFSNTSDFATARRVCDEDPTVCNPKPQNVEVRVTQVGPLRTRFEVRVREKQ